MRSPEKPFYQKKNNEKAPFFHDLAISFCGSSNVGKTTLISQLTKSISAKLHVGYVKHDAHTFSMDHSGKDTHTLKNAGAQKVFISSSKKSAFIGENSDVFSLDISESMTKWLMVDCDVVFVEGYKYSHLPKILMVESPDDGDFFFRQWKKGDLSNVIAIVSAQIGEKTAANDCFSTAIPFFYRNDWQKIEAFVWDYWQKVIQQRKLYALVLCGGKSSRMGQDKAALDYFGKPQARYVYELLGNFCEKVFISCRSEQGKQDYLQDLPQIQDRFHSFGPMGGILSAMHTFPQVSWMVVACDLPYLDKNTLKVLVEKRNPFRLATCFYNQQKKWPEPLCSVYEPKSLIKLAYNLSLGQFCPRKILSQSHISLIQSDFSAKTLKNVNTPQDKQAFWDARKKN